MVNIILNRMIDYNAGDPKRINHAIKVFSFAHNIAISEHCTEDIVFIISVASILHDIGIHNSEKKYNSSAGNYQEIEGPPVAEEILKDLSISQNALNRILYLIGNHHTYKNINGIDFQILVEADFIVNLYEDELKKETIETIKKNIFRTKSGIRILENLYLRD